MADFGVAATLGDVASTDEKDYFRGTSYWSMSATHQLPHVTSWFTHSLTHSLTRLPL
jgi:hypothetical protein